MSTPTVLVPGTWGYTGTQADAQQWWAPCSLFWQEAERHGVRLLGEHDPFVWTTDLGGALGRRRFVDWKAAGEALRWYATLKVLQSLKAGEKEPFPVEVNVVAHSHGGAVAAYAAARRVIGFRVKILVTVGTPVRADMRTIYARARKRVDRWVHLWAPGDRWQALGELLDGALGIERQMSGAENLKVEGVSHRGLLDPALWRARQWFSLLT